ncbi:facilitated trehalose transporter Tret1-like [Schistocerca nitens]|uniref:facilitated trehalose transporter Tret1-like n=1 Tax=Schistocerca nitens TaxID=7011 RepID=UPI0021187DBD|nr:facilitated trehalose transporter Tret1-like [Schistocerca nitens]
MEVNYGQDVVAKSTNRTEEETTGITSSNGELLISRRSRKCTQYLAAFIVTVGAFAVGNVVAWSAPASRELQLKFKFTLSQVSWISSFMVLGSGASVMPTGYLVDKFGRKSVMLALTIPFVGGWALIAWANTWALFCAGRFITGMACGAYAISAPIYICEIAETGIREMLGTCFQLMINVGVVFAYVLGRELDIFWSSVVCGVVPIIYGIMFAFMPETPVYYMHKGMEDEAKTSLFWLQGPDCDVEEELLQIGRNCDDNDGATKDAQSSRTAKVAFFIAIGLMSFQQLCGINAVIFYTTDIFHFVGSSIEPSICTIIVGAIQVIASLCTSLLVGVLGCRILLLISSFVMFICMYLLGLFFYLQGKYGMSYIIDIEWLPLVSICLYVAVYSFGFGPVPCIMMSVLFPRHIKGFASSVTCFLSTVLGFVIAKFFSDLIENVGIASTFWLFSVLTAIGSVFVFFVVPETRGKSLEVLQRELAGEDSRDALRS